MLQRSWTEALWEAKTFKSRYAYEKTEKAECSLRQDVLRKAQENQFHLVLIPMLRAHVAYH